MVEYFLLDADGDIINVCTIDVRVTNPRALFPYAIGDHYRVVTDVTVEQLREYESRFPGGRP